MKARIKISGLKTIETDIASIEEFDISMIPTLEMNDIYHCITVEAQTSTPRPASHHSCDDFSMLFESMEIPEDDGFRVIWSGTWYPDLGIVSSNEESKATAEALF